jgi:poly-gamma-glutamate synthesis protein (capsule biosynthesis protein)
VAGRHFLAIAVIAVGLAACGDGGPAARAAEPTTIPAAPMTTIAAVTSTTAQPTTTATTTTVPPKRPIVLGFAGDTSFTHGLHARDPLGDMTSQLSAPDLMFVNLETTVAEAEVGRRVNKTYTFKSPPESVDLLVDAGIDAVQLANNHTLDFERPALLRTLELLDEGGIAHAGAGADPAAAHAPRYLEIDGWTIGLVALSRVPCSWSASGENTYPEVAWTCDPFVVDGMTAVQEAAQHADLTIVMVHWGIELDNCPLPYQRDLAMAWESVGADLIIGGHPHVLQGVERIGDAWLIHSTGNFAFPSARQTSARSAMFEFAISEDGVRLRAIPVRITSGRPTPATGDDAAAILDDLSRWSFGFAFDDGGIAVATGEPGACG